MQLRLGTRASDLARWQANWVAERLRGLGAAVQLVPISTSGDLRQDTIAAGSAVGVFTKELERGLLDERIDLAVHSVKDLPTEPVPGLTLAAIPERGEVGDVLVSREHLSLERLGKGAVIGTGSLRRRAQLLHVRPDLTMRDVRGNVDTRLGKLAEGQYDAVILAEAGLRRLARDDAISQRLPLPLMLPAVGQGALGLQTRSDDNALGELLTAVDHRATHAAVAAERSMLAALAGGCLAPIAAWGRIDGNELVLTGRVLDPNGRQKVETTAAAPPDDAVELGRRVAENLLAQGAAELIHQARGPSKSA